MHINKLRNIYKKRALSLLKKQPLKAFIMQDIDVTAISSTTNRSPMRNLMLHGITGLIMLSICCLSYSKAFARPFDLPVFKNALGDLTFILDSSNSQKALRTISVAQKLLEQGLNSVIIFDKSGVLLTVNHSRSSQQRPTSPIRILTQQQMDAMGTMSQRSLKLEEVLFEETMADSSLEKLRALTARKRVVLQLETFMGLGGEVIVCAKCLSTFGYNKSSLIHNKINSDPQRFQNKLKGIDRN